MLPFHTARCTARRAPESLGLTTLRLGYPQRQYPTTNLRASLLWCWPAPTPRRPSPEPNVPAPKHYVSIHALSAFLRRHGISTAPGEHPVVHRFLQTVKLRHTDAGIVCIRDFLKDGAIAGVVARALLATLVVPSVEEFADSINSMLAHAMVSCRRLRPVCQGFCAFKQGRR